MISAVGQFLGQGGSGSSPDTFASLFPGAWYIHGDPGVAGYAPFVDGDRMRWRDNSGAGNDKWAYTSPLAAPWEGIAPATTTVDGRTVPLFNAAGMAFEGWMSAPLTGENLLQFSEALAAPWTFANVVVAAGPAPPDPYTESTTLTDSGGSALHYAVQTPPATHYVSGQRYSLQLLLRKSAGSGWVCVSIDGHFATYVDLNTGVLGNIDGTGLMVDQTTGATWAANTQVSGPHDLMRVESLGGGWYLFSCTIVANAAAASNLLYVYLAPNNGAIFYAASGNAINVSGVSLRPARTLTRPAYTKSVGAALVNPTHGPATFVCVAQSTSTGPRGIAENTNATFANSVGPRIGTDTGIFHTQGMRANGTDYNYTRAPGNLDSHIVVADPVGNQIRVYRKGVLVSSNTCTTWLKPAVASRLGGLHGGLWNFTGPLAFASYFGDYVANDATAAAMSAYLTSKFPSIA
jgi:hypothetical protein